MSQMKIDPAKSEDTTVMDEVRAFLDRARDAGELVTLESKVEYLTPAEVARRTGMSRSTVSRKIKAGEIATIKVGSHHRIPAKEYERFRDAQFGDMVGSTSAELEAELYGDQ